MSVVQSSYPDEIAVAYNGQLVQVNSKDIHPYVVETAVIPVGVACQQGTNAEDAKVGIAANKFIGISIRDRTYGPENTSNKKLQYPVGQGINILIRGIVWVEVESAVTVGANVTAKTTTGALSTAAVSGTQILISGARWLTAQSSANGLAQLYLDGSLPSA